MSKYYSGAQIVRALQRVGFWQVSQKGSHAKLRGLWKGKLQTVIVPMHKEIAWGTFQNILKQAEMNSMEFESFVR